ncbi:hypothetical protein PUN28_004194 [Cardiocondyla obscurior]|uniref:Acylphosphatase n=1 Tax=Cardiocondyla obscurior TaxID=286306 RepID=A0AAW2GPY8_9HYME
MVGPVFLVCLAFAVELPRPTAMAEAEAATKTSKLIALDFEVHGTVQGVFFRKFTQKRSKELGLTGWCKNTRYGSVIGYLEGEQAQIETMKQWLRDKGSPQSRVELAEFTNEKEIPQLSLSSFEIRKK